jgi:hypothetical protein
MPYIYTPELKAALKERIVALLFDMPPKRVLEQEGMPSRREWYNWMDEDADFCIRCARAREEYAETLLDDMQGLEDDVLDGTLDAQAAKVVISSRQWRAEKLKPRKFGPKVDLNHGGTVTITLSKDEAAL